MTKVGFVSLGCSKNLVDTEVMLRTLYDAGFEITPDESEAEIIVVNTCGFIEAAKSESIDAILELARLKEDGTLKYLIAAGCLAQRYGEEVLTELPELDGIVGVGGIDKIAEACEAVMRGERFVCLPDKEKSPLGGERILTTPDYTAYIKIAEGCDNRCTYCAIPMIRGGLRSRTIEDIVREAKELEALGVKEINLIAQDTSRYGLDLYGELSLARLIRAICDATEIPWIRLLYLYPDKITDELISELKNNDRLLKYVDIPIQHISDKVLTAMNRHGGSELIRTTVKRLRDEVPDIVLRTTAMVGFPGESEEDFCALCEFVKEARFERFGAFTYSSEEGTAAAELADDVDAQTKQDRYDILMQTQLTVSEDIGNECIGKTFEVLCEGFDTVAEVYYGRSFRDAPDVDGRVYFKSPRKKISEGEFVDVIIEQSLDYDLVGTAVIG